MDIGQASTRIWGAPYHYVVDLPISVNVADFSACYKCRDHPTDIARFESIAKGLVEVHLDLYVRHVLLEFRVHISSAVDLSEGLPHLLCLGAKDV